MDRVHNSCNAKNGLVSLLASAQCGKVALPQLQEPRKPSHGLLTSSNMEYILLQIIWQYNCCFQMINFGTNQIVKNRWTPTFMI